MHLTAQLVREITGRQRRLLVVRRLQPGPGTEVLVRLMMDEDQATPGQKHRTEAGKMPPLAEHLLRQGKRLHVSVMTGHERLLQIETEEPHKTDGIILTYAYNQVLIDDTTSLHGRFISEKIIPAVLLFM